MAGTVNIDTGAVFFAPAVLNALFALICDDAGKNTEKSFKRYVNAHIAPSLYVDFFYPLAEDSNLEGYLKETPVHLMSDELLKMRYEIWKALRPYRIKLLRIESGKFIHFGSTEEVSRLMCRELEKYTFLGWKRVICSSVPKDFSGAAWCSTVEDGTEIGCDVYLEKSIIKAGSKVGSGSIVSNSIIEDGEQVPDNVLLHSMKLVDGSWCCKISGIAENPKRTIKIRTVREDSKQLSFDEISSSKITNAATSTLGKIEAVLDNGSITVAQLWLPEEKTILWDARIFPVRASMSDAIHDALTFWHTGVVPKLPRTSMNESFNLANGCSLI